MSPIAKGENPRGKNRFGYSQSFPTIPCHSLPFPTIPSHSQPFECLRMRFFPLDITGQPYRFFLPHIYDTCDEYFKPSRSFNQTVSLLSMNWLLIGRKKRDKNNSSNIEVYHNIQFPLDDILDVFYPLFGSYYLYDDFIYMIYSVNNIFCAYDKRQNRCIACALVNNADTPGGLYIMLFGVRQSDQGRGAGTYLLSKIIQWARQRGYSFIQLDVHIENHKAIGLYEKVGFVKYKYIPNYYGNLPKYPPHAFRMILSLH
jgi:ribosomal protein S18 acetylase RimI-like enzyme